MPRPRLVLCCHLYVNCDITCRILPRFLSLIIITLNVHFVRFSVSNWDAILLSGLSALQAEQGDPATRRVNEVLIYSAIKLN